MKVYPGGVQARARLGWFLGQSAQDTASAESSTPAYLPQDTTQRTVRVRTDGSHPLSGLPSILLSDLAVPPLTLCLPPPSPLFFIPFLFNPDLFSTEREHV